MSPARVLFAVAATALLAGGCGGERTFEAGEFVEAANAEGAGLVLGEPLTSSQDELELFQVSFAEGEEEHAEEEHSPTEHHHSSGTLALAADADAAEAEFRRCEGAVSLSCYRAANAVLYFEAAPDEPEVARVDAAIRDLASD